MPGGSNRQLDGANVVGLEADRNSRGPLSRICDQSSVAASLPPIAPDIRCNVTLGGRSARNCRAGQSGDQDNPLGPWLGRNCLVLCVSPRSIPFASLNLTAMPRLQVNVAEQLARSIVAAAHATSPNLVGANESRSPVGGECLFQQPARPTSGADGAYAGRQCTHAGIIYVYVSRLTYSVNSVRCLIFLRWVPRSSVMNDVVGRFNVYA